jgi:hypothetical protein
MEDTNGIKGLKRYNGLKGQSSALTGNQLTHEQSGIEVHARGAACKTEHKACC